MATAIGAGLAVVSASTGDACLDSIDSGARMVPLLRRGLSATSGSASSVSPPAMWEMIGTADTARQGLIPRDPGGDTGLATLSSVSQEGILAPGGAAISGLRRFNGKNLRAPTLAVAFGPIPSPELP